MIDQRANIRHGRGHARARGAGRAPLPWLAAGLLLALAHVLVSPDVQARRRAGSIDEFCQQEPDLCVFVCHDRERCTSMPDGWVCENRRGRPILFDDFGDLEDCTMGPERPRNRVDYSYCWHASATHARLPDPELTYVPEYPGDIMAGLCTSCEVGSNRCLQDLLTREHTCSTLFEAQAWQYCKKTLQRHGRPLDHLGRLMVPADEHCARILRPDDDIDETGTDMAEHHRELRRLCEVLLVEQCVEDHARSHPEDGNLYDQWPPLHRDDFVGREYLGTVSIPWTGSVGYFEACRVTFLEQGAFDCIHASSSCRAALDSYNRCDEPEPADNPLSLDHGAVSGSLALCLAQRSAY